MKKKFSTHIRKTEPYLRKVYNGEEIVAFKSLCGKPEPTGGFEKDPELATCRLCQKAYQSENPSPLTPKKKSK